VSAGQKSSLINHTPVRGHKHPLKFWQRSALLAFAILFAFVLPFICWGAFATPGHPHLSAHFVFAAPVQSAQQILASTADRTGAIALHIAAACGLLVEPLSTAESSVDGSPIGRSTPSMSTAISLIVIVALAAWTLYRAIPWRGDEMRQPLADHLADPHVPTPPPRA
jgi:hypothetical protein